MIFFLVVLWEVSGLIIINVNVYSFVVYSFFVVVVIVLICCVRAVEKIYVDHR